MTQEAGVPGDIWDKINKMIDRKIGELARSAPLRNASISEGGITVKGGFIKVSAADGGTTFYVGGILPPLPDGTYQPGMILRREDDTVAMALYDPTPDPASPDGYKQFLAVYDRGQNIIVSDDTSSGQGIARPYVPGVFYRERYADWVTTTSTTFETLFTAVVYKQHPRLWVQVWASNDTSGATGQLRVLVNGVPWQATASTGFTVATTSFGPAPVDGAHMASLRIEVQARVASGTGGVRVEPRAAHGMQS